MGQYRCTLLTCCSSRVSSDPYEADWRFEPLVRAAQQQIPPEVAAAVSALSIEQLTEPRGVAYPATITDHDGDVDTVGELTVGWIAVPLQQFAAAMPPADWGVNLFGYLGGDVPEHHRARDEQGRIVRQVERMILNPRDDWLVRPLADLDMTKTETIHYAADRAEVLWRVYRSDNGTVEADLGSVEFRAQAGGTLVTFHSYHRLVGPLGIPLPAWLVELMLPRLFADHIRHYAEIVSP